MVWGEGDGVREHWTMTKETSVKQLIWAMYTSLVIKGHVVEVVERI